MRSFFESRYSFLSTATRDALAPPPSDWVDVRVLAGGVSETHTVPTDATMVLFSATGDFYVKFGGSNAISVNVPSGDVTDGTAGILNPTARSLLNPSGGTYGYIALNAPASCTVTLEFYKA